MTEHAHRTLRNWLYVVCGLVFFMVLFGGYVRLTRSGLSIVEWNVFRGIIPPIGDAAWQAEFAKYQLTPEGQKVNASMTLAEYKFIFYNEWVHRLVARFAGLVVAIPPLYYLWRGTLPRRRAPFYLGIVALFGFQGFMGWYMVSSGLVDRPAVSHFRLTIHLLLALTLLGLAYWRAQAHDARFAKPVPGYGRSTGFWLAIVIMAALLIQIAYGGLVAGLKAGYVSNTWPLMFGYLVPPGLMTVVQPAWRNLVESMPTVHFIHRWFAFVVLLAVGGLWWVARRQGYLASVRRLLTWLLALVAVQITLGVSVIWFGVPIVLALTHQGTALVLFLVTLRLLYLLVHEALPEAVATPIRARAQSA